MIPASRTSVNVPAETTGSSNRSTRDGSRNRGTRRFAGLGHEQITFWQGVAIIFGANIGAGILSLPYGARTGGFPALVIALVIAGFLTTASMLHVAEVALRTDTPLQLSGLARKYLGNAGSWLIFAGIFINGFGALIAYASGGGEVLSGLLGIPQLAGSLLFYVPGVVVVWLGLKATGRSEQAITAGMALLIAVLVGWTLVGPGIDVDNVSFLQPYYIVPIMNLAVFAFIAQYTVPELARGLAEHPPRVLPQARSGTGRWASRSSRCRRS